VRTDQEGDLLRQNDNLRGEGDDRGAGADEEGMRFDGPKVWGKVQRGAVTHGNSSFSAESYIGIILGIIILLQHASKKQDFSPSAPPLDDYGV